MNQKNLTLIGYLVEVSRLLAESMAILDHEDERSVDDPMFQDLCILLNRIRADAVAVNDMVTIGTNTSNYGKIETYDQLEYRQE